MEPVQPEQAYVGNGTPINQLVGGGGPPQQHQPPPQHQMQHQPQHQQQHQQRQFPLHPSMYESPIRSASSGGYASPGSDGARSAYTSPAGANTIRSATQSAYASPAPPSMDALEEKTGVAFKTLAFVIFLFVVLASPWVVTVWKKLAPIPLRYLNGCPPLVIVIINALLFGTFFVLYSWGVLKR